MEVFYGDLFLVKLPETDSLRWLAALRRTLALEIPLMGLAEQARSLPLLLCTRYQGRQFRQLMNAHPELEGYLQFQTKAHYISSLWGWQQKKAPQPEPEPVDLQVFPRLAGLIAGQNSKAAQAVAQCAADPEDYFHQHRQQYLQRGVQQPEQPETLCLLALADQLAEAGLLWELDWKTEQQEFLSVVRQLADRQHPNLPLDPDWFQQQQDMADWIDLLNEKWLPFGFYLSELAMDSDSFSLLCLSLDLLAQLQKAAPNAFH